MYIYIYIYICAYISLSLCVYMISCNRTSTYAYRVLYERVRARRPLLLTSACLHPTVLGHTRLYKPIHTILVYYSRLQ